MAVFKNVASQKLAVFAWDTTADAAKTGDAANITGYISKDAAAMSATNDANPTELDATNAPGVYIFDATQAETNANMLVLFATSSTADIKLDPMIVYTMAVGVGNRVAVDAEAVSGSTTAADNVEANIANLDAAVSSRSTLSAADVNTEVVDVLRIDTMTELVQGIPPATPTMEDALMLLYMAVRNKLTVTATEKGIHNDAGTKVTKKTLADDGTTYTESEAVSGA